MLKFGNSFVNVGGTYLTGFKSPKRTITIIPSNGGVIAASPNKGNDGDLVTLSNTPNAHYHFNGYSLTGGTLTGSQFSIQGNASAQGSFEQDPIRNLTLSQQTGGTIAANKTTGWDGDVVSLSNTASNTHYIFNNYSLTGSTLYNTNKFKFKGSDVTAKANFTYTIVPTDCSAKIGTQTWMTKNLSYDDGGSGVYHRDLTVNGANLGTQYYYTDGAAVRIANKINGWHLPTSAEWNTLINYAGGIGAAGNKLRSTTGWNGNNGADVYGFSAEPAGGYYPFIPGYGNEGYEGKFRTNTRIDTNTPIIIDFWYDNHITIGYENYTTSNSGIGYSVRLVKD